MNPEYKYQQIPWIDNASERIQFGRILVGMEDSETPRLDLYNYNYTRLPAYLIYTVLKIILDEGWIDKLERLHTNRNNNWKVEVISSSEKTKEYRLFVVEASEAFCSSVVTITYGQIENYSILAEDAAPLLKKIVEDYPPVFLPRYRNYRYTYCFPNYSMWSGKMMLSGLPQVIVAQREKQRQMISTKHTRVITDALEAGKKSEISETIEAMKCLEVLRA